MSNRPVITTAEWPAPLAVGGALKTLRVDGRRIAYQDVGTGPTIILAHCSSGSHKEWAPFVARLSSRYRILAPDLLGYGRSERWPINAPLPETADVNVLLALAELAGEPVHLGGHSYGGTVALEAARTLGQRVKSLTLIEPVAFHLLRLAGRLSAWYEVNAVGERMTHALRMRRERKAASVYMSYWIGRLRWWAIPAGARRRVIETIGKVAAEFDNVQRLSRTLGDYRSIVVPTRLIAGERTRNAARLIIDELLTILPDAQLSVVARAGHMSPITHPEAVVTLMEEHIDAHQSEPVRVQAADPARPAPSYNAAALEPTRWVRAG